MEKKLHETNAAQTADQERTFKHLLREYEAAVAAGTDTTAKADREAAALLALAQAVALSVVAKCIDPQRKAATTRETVSNSGQNPALREIRRGIMADLALLDNTTAAHNAATAFRYNAEGDYVREVVDPAAEKAAAALMEETLSEGIDLVNTAAMAILKEMQKPVLDPEEWADMPHIKTRYDAHMWASKTDKYYAEMNPLFMETPYTVRRLSRKVLIRAEDSAKWERVETSPISEVYRAVRREVQNSKAMQTDPRNGYSYIEDTAADPDSTATETIYRRLHKWADLGGYTMTGHFDPHGNASRGGQYTTSAAAVADYDSALHTLNLTTAQATFIRLRMAGYGGEAIATYMGVSSGRVYNIAKAIRTKCEKTGFVPHAALAASIDKEGRIASREEVRSVMELLATADSLEADGLPTADNARFVAWDEAEKLNVSAAEVEEEKLRVAFEVGCLYRNGKEEEAFALAEKYGISSKICARYM